MNSTIVGICLNGITVSTEEYTIGYSSPNGIQQRHRTVPCLSSSIMDLSTKYIILVLYIEKVRSLNPENYIHLICSKIVLFVGII